MGTRATNNARLGSVASRVLASTLTNALMGIIYVWGLFLLPLEKNLGLTRSDLSFVPSTALVSFTAGMVVHSHLLRRMGAFRFAICAFLLAGGGHLFFGLSPSYSTLLIGYGVLFGLGAGLGYGLALATVTSLPADRRASALGLTMAAFASSGIIIPVLLGSIVRTIPPATSFSLIGVATLVVGAAVVILIARGRCIEPSGHVATSDSSSKVINSAFVALGVVFFAISFAGLLAIAQAAGMITSNGLSPRIVDLSIGLLTAGYLAGSLFGGKLAEAISARLILVLASAFSSLGICLLNLPSPPAVIVGALAVGASFGSSASFMPIVIGRQFGTSQIGHIYGRLMISYGLAALIAPTVSGWLFELDRNYCSAVLISITLCVAAALLSLRMPRPEWLEVA